MICWYDMFHQNMVKNTKLCYMDTDSFTVYIKTVDVYKDIAQDIETIFDTSDRPLT